MTQEQRAAVGAIKRVLSEHTAILGANIKCQCGATSAIPAEHAHHVADVLVSELGLVLS